MVVLLHGMVAAGYCYGAAFDQIGASARVVVPDLLGFGGSMARPAARPDLPVPVARAAVQHTWGSYHGALNDLVRSPQWRHALDRLAAAAVPVPGRAAALAAAHPNMRHLTHPHGTHTLPLSEGQWCAGLIASHLDGTA